MAQLFGAKTIEVPDPGFAHDLKAIDAPLESLPACYSFVEIPAGGRRTAQARSWRLNEQRWSIANGGC